MQRSSAIIEIFHHTNAEEIREKINDFSTQIQIRTASLSSDLIHLILNRLQKDATAAISVALDSNNSNAIFAFPVQFGIFQKIFSNQSTRDIKIYSSFFKTDIQIRNVNILNNSLAQSLTAQAEDISSEPSAKRRKADETHFKVDEARISVYSLLLINLLNLHSTQTETLSQFLSWLTPSQKEGLQIFIKQMIEKYHSVGPTQLTQNIAPFQASTNTQSISTPISRSIFRTPPLAHPALLSKQPVQINLPPPISFIGNQAQISIPLAVSMPQAIMQDAKKAAPHKCYGIVRDNQFVALKDKNGNLVFTRKQAEEIASTQNIKEELITHNTFWRRKNKQAEIKEHGAPLPSRYGIVRDNEFVALKDQNEKLVFSLTQAKEIASTQNIKEKPITHSTFRRRKWELKKKESENQAAQKISRKRKAEQSDLEGSQTRSKRRRVKSATTKKRKPSFDDLDSSDDQTLFSSEDSLLSSTTPIKKEPEYSKPRPSPIQLNGDYDELRAAVEIARGNNNSNENCDYLAHRIINYLLTREMPKKAVPENASDGFYETDPRRAFVKVPIKEEYQGEIHHQNKRRKIVTTSIVDRNTFFGAYAPAQEIPFQDGNTIDLTKPPIIAVDSYYEKHALYTEIEATLIKEASQADCKIAIGTIGLERKIGKEIGHLLVYYATEKEVIYIDCQAFDGETLEGDPIIETSLRKEFYFDGYINPNRRSKEDCFCPRVFYTPMNHARPLEYDATTEENSNSSNSSSNAEPTPTYGSRS